VPENDSSPLQPQFDFLSFACDLLEAKVSGKAHADPPAIPDQVAEQPKKSGNVFKDAAQAAEVKRAAARMSAQEEQNEGEQDEGHKSSPELKPKVSEDEQRALKDQVKSIGKKRTEAARKPQNNKVEEPVLDPAAKRGKSSVNDARKLKKLQ
jgi:DNA repair photolyase